ncbi:MAG: hypothetical protein ABI851_11610 [Saprospiraceae bacterium]
MYRFKSSSKQQLKSWFQETKNTEWKNPNEVKKEYSLIFNYVCEILSKNKSPKIDEAFNHLIANPDKYYFQIIDLWNSLDKQKEKGNPIRKNLIKKLGIREINRRLTEYNEMDYWKLATEEKNY